MRRILVFLVTVLVGVAAMNAQRVYSSSGSYQGEIRSDGRIYSSSGSYLGEVRSDGRVYSSSGTYLGEARNVSRHKAAIFFFFQL